MIVRVARSQRSSSESTEIHSSLSSSRFRWTTTLPKAGAEKLTRYDNPRIEQLIAEGRVPDPKVRQQKYEEIEKALWEDEPEIWPYYSVAIYAVSDKLQNYQARRDYYVLLYDVGLR